MYGAHRHVLLAAAAGMIMIIFQYQRAGLVYSLPGQPKDDIKKLETLVALFILAYPAKNVHTCMAMYQHVA